jgi:ribonuclease HI
MPDGRRAEFTGISVLAAVSSFYPLPATLKSTMSFRPDSPVDLPGGRLACGLHHQQVCPICCVDYTFLDEGRSDEDGPVPDNRSNGGLITRVQLVNPRPIIGTGEVIFEKFFPPNRTDSPSSLFPPDVGNERFINRTDPTQFLIYTDGACLDNGRENPRGGCAFFFKPPVPPTISGYYDFRLENKGPTGEPHPQTSNRAELRAAIAVLRFASWTNEGFKTLVIATDSEYVVEGATNWVRGWLRRGWRTSAGALVKNKDLWQVLLGEAERWSLRGLDVRFWQIPREQNTVADQRTKEGATKEDSDEFIDVRGIGI